MSSLTTSTAQSVLLGVGRFNTATLRTQQPEERILITSTTVDVGEVVAQTVVPVEVDGVPAHWHIEMVLTTRYLPSLLQDLRVSLTTLNCMT
jgi:hypothetical protein